MEITVASPRPAPHSLPDGTFLTGPSSIPTGRYTRRGAAARDRHTRARVSRPIFARFSFDVLRPAFFAVSCLAFSRSGAFSPCFVRFQELRDRDTTDQRQPDPRNRARPLCDAGLRRNVGAGDLRRGAYHQADAVSLLRQQGRRL